jgi:hypothetical protein
MSRFPRAAAVALVATVLAAPTLSAQEYTWTHATSFKLENVPGLIARMLGSGRETTETHFLAGQRYRVESGNSASIVDVPAGHLLQLDTRARTYTRLTFQELAAIARELQEEAEMQALMAEGRQPERAQQKDEEEYEFSFDMSVEATGQRQTHAGYDSRQAIVTVSATAVPKDEKKRREAGEPGALVFLIDHWTSRDAPHAAAVQAYEQAFSEKAVSSFGGMSGLDALFAQYPGMKEGWEAAIREMKKVEGVATRTTTYIVSVPPGLKLDRAAVLSPKPEEPREGAGGRLGRMARAAAESAAGQPARGDRADAPRTQTVILSTLSELREVKAGGVPAGAFDVPSGFREVKQDQKKR